MPRIEILPAGWWDSRARLRGDGAPTLDVCHRCAPQFTEGDLIDDIWRNDWPGVVPDHSLLRSGAVIGSTEVAHPAYCEDLICEICRRVLGQKDE